MRRTTLLLITVLLAACSSPEEGGVAVATTIYPVEFVVEQVGGAEIDVINVTPSGAEPHDLELDSERVIDIVGADLVVYIGEGFQPAVEESLDDAEGTTLEALTTVGGPPDPETSADVHFWLDPRRLAELAGAVADSLSEIDPGNDGYTTRADELSMRLYELDETFERALANCRSREIVTAHEAFGYLADRYQLTQTGISGIDPETEISPQRLADVIEFVRANDVGTIFFETLLPPDAAETIARETGADTATLDPLESEPEKGDYFSVMENNLRVLREALGCR